ncbi:MAG: hypothetical protein IJA89_03405 [Clostridia bacterium]|nr:hypothetical protein [Clostridia bacterium]
MRKKFLIPLLTLCMATATFIACDKKTEDESDTSKTETSTELAITLSLNKNMVTIDTYQTLWLFADYNGDETITWSVSDASVVSLDGGKLTGLKEGTATVTAKAGDLTDTCQVTVRGYNAEQLAIQLDETNVAMYKGDEQTIVTAITYQGNTVSANFAKTFTSSNTDVLTVDNNGKITAKALGEASVSVVCTVAGNTLSGTVNVSVVSSGKVEIEQEYIEINVVGADNTATLTAKVYEKDVEQTNPTLVWTATDGQDVLTVNDGVITAQNAGETTVSVSYTDNDGQTKTDSVTVTVLPVEIQTEESLTLMKNEIEDGYAVADLQALMNTSEVFTNVWVEADGLKTTLDITDGKVDFHSLSSGNKSLYLQTRNVAYEVALELWTATLSSAADLETLYAATDGWYRLGANINMSGVIWSYEGETEFTGIFDGNGYTISNLTVSENGGLFDTLAQKAIVRNVKFASAKITSAVSGGGVVAFATSAQATTDVTLENVYVEVDNNGTYSGGLIGLVEGKTTIKGVSGVVVNANGDTTNGALIGRAANEVLITGTNAVYSGATICGNAQEANDMAEELNAITGVIQAPTATNSKNNLDFETTGSCDITLGSGTYESYTVYGNAVRTVANATGTITLQSADVDGRYGGSVEVLLKKANGVEYYSIPLEKSIYLSQANFVKYLSVNGEIKGDFILTEDIDMTQYAIKNSNCNWTQRSTNRFAGTLDGQNHVIKNLTFNNGVNPNSGVGGDSNKKYATIGFFYQIDGNTTIKNIAFTNVTMGHATLGGTIAYQVAKEVTLTLDNVYISMNETAFIGSGTNVYRSGVVAILDQAASKLELKNTVVCLPVIETTQTNYGCAVGYGSMSGSYIETENSTFIGGNGQFFGVRIDGDKDYTKVTVTQGENTVLKADKVSVTATDTAGWSQMQKDAWTADNA